jgi:hypothetical protein
VDNLATYLIERLPEGMSYDDAVQLCLRLFVTIEGVPEALLPLPRKRLCAAFSYLSAAGWVHLPKEDKELRGFRYGAHLYDCISDEHWSKVIDSILREPCLRSIKKGEGVARRVGFISRIPVGGPGASPT